MSHAKLPPFIYWRDGRPRFIPGSRERDLGFAGADLRHANGGAWFSFEEAKAFGLTRYAAIMEARAGGRKVRPATTTRATIADLLEDWLNAPAVRDRAEHTQRGYRGCVNAIMYRPETDAEQRTRRQAARAAELAGKAKPERTREAFSLAPVSAIAPPDVHAFIEYIIAARGRHTGHACRAALRAAFAWARVSPDWRLKDNPAAGLRFKKPAGRIVIWTDAEIRAMVETADRQGRGSIGDSVLLGLFTGQRQGDRLALIDEGLIDGRRQFRQSKTGAVVAIRETPRLMQRLNEARARVAARTLKLGTRPQTVIVDEATGNTYAPDTYRHIFADVRARAAQTKGFNAIAFKRDQDLRDTAVTWMARAGATTPEIAAITGHDPKSIYTILKHYLAITPELADSAIAKLVTWMSNEGMVV